MSIARIIYAGGTPGADTNTYTLFDSADPNNTVSDKSMYRLRLQNSAAGTVKGYYKDDTGTYVQFYEQSVPASSSTGMNGLRVRIEPYKFVKFTWVNGGSAQSTWRVRQSLGNHDFGPGIHSEAASRFKGPLSGTDNFAQTIGTTHAVYAVRSDWAGRRVTIKNQPNASAPTATIWFLFGASSGMEVDRTAVVTGTPPAWTGDAKIGIPIAPGEAIDRYVDPTVTHFAAESDDNTNKPTLSIFVSDYAIAEG